MAMSPHEIRSSPLDISPFDYMTDCTTYLPVQVANPGLIRNTAAAVGLFLVTTSAVPSTFPAGSLPFTSPGIMVARRAESAEAQPLTSIAQTREVVDKLGLSKAELARLLGVSRPTLYAWLSGEGTPTGDNAEILGHLAEVVATLGDWSGPLFWEYVKQPLPGESGSILALLAARAWRDPKLPSLIERAKRLTMERDAQLARMTNTGDKSSSREREKTLTQNLQDLGLDG